MSGCVWTNFGDPMATRGIRSEEFVAGWGFEAESYAPVHSQVGTAHASEVVEGMYTCESATYNCRELDLYMSTSGS